LIDKTFMSGFNDFRHSGAYYARGIKRRHDSSQDSRQVCLPRERQKAAQNNNKNK
jgi:hypothetical protein